MDLKEAFYKQKEELNQLKRDYAKLEKKHIKAIKENAADERVQELLKKIQGLYLIYEVAIWWKSFCCL